ncbi:6-phosphogluconolactonase [Chitinophaga cymbidii]|uniref:Glucosamine-6-phosphate deaminase n=1 Tax=Chitinophaga cymbidii TaxID=1096750 RepID=A0A512RLJ8_9BACT|nr:glucosamine-6-phosphate deaminase [Chitinophaga cymbidii]GEP96578.1 glucosamine-6-phosphate deaminase [Chitinophaga cymbidii]
MIREFLKDNMQVRIYSTREGMGNSAAALAAQCLRELLQRKDEVNLIFAAAASQVEFLDAIALEKNIPWERVNAFHMDEYIGLPVTHPQRFGNFLDKRIFSKLPLKKVYYLNETGDDTEAESARYAALLQKMPPDVTFMGIGENTHLAFNDPHVADFNDAALVRIIDLDEPCKQQQVHDGCFPSVADVPSWAYTLTIPALLRSTYIFCMVPGKNKAQAIKHTLTEAVTAKYPSTALRNHRNAVLFLDKDSAALIL